jgi:Tol biopolymer transport system component
VITALIVAAAATAVGVYWIAQSRARHRTKAVQPFSLIDISRVTTSGEVTHSAISPNGKYVANIVKHLDGNSLWLKHVGVPSNVRLAGPAMTEYISVTFAPDGNSIYYIALDHDKGVSTLYSVPTLGGPSTKVADDIYPVGFSPDGKRIAFFRMHQDESTLVVAEGDGSNQRVVATKRNPEVFEMEWNAPAWAPDGKTIACPIRLSDERGYYKTIIAVNPTDGTQALLTSARWNTAGQSVWLPDSSGLLLTAVESEGSPMQVWHISLPDGVATRVSHDLNDYHDLSLTSDASHLAVVQVQAVSNIWVASGSDGHAARQISSEIGSLEVLAWTPDGRIVYRSGAGGNGADIWIMNADGSNAKQLTVGARASRGLAVTPDGRHIVFVSDRAGQFNIWRVDTDGGNLRQLTARDGEYYPHCSADGQWVVFQSDHIDPKLWKVHIEGGEPFQLTRTRATRPAVSPDGQMIAYSYLDLDLRPPRWGIGIVSTEGGERLNRFDFPPSVVYRAVRWSPDSKSIAFVNSPNGRSDIWLQPLDGSAPKQLTNFEAEQILAFEWSPDGHSLSFVRNVETSDVVLIEQKQQ